VQPQDNLSDAATVSSLQSEMSLKYHHLEQKVQEFMLSQTQTNDETKTYVDKSIAAI